MPGLSRGLDGVMTVCVKLATVIHANFHVAATVYAERGRLALYDDFREHHDTRIRGLAIELAVNFRVFDESAQASPAYLNLRAGVDAQSHSGFVLPDNTPLPLRECSNKIIHAKDFKFEMAEYRTVDAVSGVEHRNPCKASEILVLGDLYGKVWSCRIDLLTYAERVHEVCSRWVAGAFTPA